MFNRLKTSRWNIGFVQNSIENVLKGGDLSVKWLKHSFVDHSFADPFILNVDDSNIYVLVEDIHRPTNRTRISELVIDKNTMELKKLHCVLDLETHLSFPAIIRDGKNIWVHPENYLSGGHYMYKYNPNTKQLEDRNLIINEPLTDSIITDLFGQSIMFTTFQPEIASNCLSIYTKKDGQFTNREDIYFDENIARMAGDFFMFENRIYRPAQECNESYGHGISIQEVKYKDGKWFFKEVRRLFSPHKTLNLSFHTLNMYKGIIVVDAMGADMSFPLILKRLYRKIFNKGKKYDW